MGRQSHPAGRVPGAFFPPTPVAPRRRGVGVESAWRETWSCTTMRSYGRRSRTSSPPLTGLRSSARPVPSSAGPVRVGGAPRIRTRPSSPGAVHLINVAWTGSGSRRRSQDSGAGGVVACQTRSRSGHRRDAEAVWLRPAHGGKLGAAFAVELPEPMPRGLRLTALAVSPACCAHSSTHQHAFAAARVGTGSTGVGSRHKRPLAMSRFGAILPA